MLCAQREQKKKREEEEKAKEESLRKAKEETEIKESEEREKIKQESNLEIQSQVVELNIISNEKRELSATDLVINPSPIPYMKIPFPKFLNSSHFFIKSFVLFPSQIFCSPSHSLISYSLTFCAKTHFDSKILFKNHLSQSVRHSCEVGLIPTFSNFMRPFSHIPQSLLLHGHYDFNSILFDDYCKFVFDPGETLTLVVVGL